MTALPRLTLYSPSGVVAKASPLRLAARRLGALGFDVAVEAGAGLGSGLQDQDYAAAGADIAPDSQAALGGADVIVHGPGEAEQAHVTDETAPADLIAPAAEAYRRVLAELT